MKKKTFEREYFEKKMFEKEFWKKNVWKNILKTKFLIKREKKIVKKNFGTKILREKGILHYGVSLHFFLINVKF